MEVLNSAVVPLAIVIYEGGVSVNNLADKTYQQSGLVETITLVLLTALTVDVLK